MSGIKKYFSRIAFLIIIITALAVSNCSKNEIGVIAAPGVVNGDIITLKSAVAGTILKLSVAEGDKIVKDAPLVQINPDKIENQLKEIEITGRDIAINSDKLSRKLQFQNSDILYIKKQVDRFRRLKAKNAIPGENLESMELRLQQAESVQYDIKRSLESLDVQKEQIKNKREYLRLLMNDHSIKSPVNGVVVEKFVSEGEQVFPGTALADVLDLTSLRVEIYIEENEMGRLKLNQEAKITVDGLPGKTLSGSISFFGKKAEFSPKYILSEKERKSLLYEVKIKVQDPDGILKIGMPVTVMIRPFQK